METKPGQVHAPTLFSFCLGASIIELVPQEVVY